MAGARLSLKFVLAAAMCGLFSTSPTSALQPPKPEDTVALETSNGKRGSLVTQPRIFSGAFVTQGEFTTGTCVFPETWTFSTVEFDLVRKEASFIGQRSGSRDNPVTPLCIEGNSAADPIVFGIPLTVNGASVRASGRWSVFPISVSATISGQSLIGTFRATPTPTPRWQGEVTGNFTLASAAPSIMLQRETLTSLRAIGAPTGGRFAYSGRPITGRNVATIEPNPTSGPTANPNKARLKNPSNPNPSGAPAPGGLVEIMVTYLRQAEANKSFFVPTFGLSCYNNALESDWGTPPSTCRSVRINGVRYSGIITDPYGLKGVYCASFIAEVRLQGSGLTKDGRKIQYEPSSLRISEVANIQSADGTPVAAGRTLARDRSVIPRNVLVDIAGVGDSLLANDTGGAIKGYRIDLFKGAGQEACEGFSNKISIAACRPGNSKCPARDIPE